MYVRVSRFLRAKPIIVEKVKGSVVVRQGGSSWGLTKGCTCVTLDWSVSVGALVEGEE